MKQTPCPYLYGNAREKPGRILYHGRLIKDLFLLSDILNLPSQDLCSSFPQRLPSLFHFIFSPRRAPGEAVPTLQCSTAAI